MPVRWDVCDLGGKYDITKFEMLLLRQIQRMTLERPAAEGGPCAAVSLSKRRLASEMCRDERFFRRVFDRLATGTTALLQRYNPPTEKRGVYGFDRSLILEMLAPVAVAAAAPEVRPAAVPVAEKPVSPAPWPLVRGSKKPWPLVRVEPPAPEVRAAAPWPFDRGVAEVRAEKPWPLVRGYAEAGAEKPWPFARGVAGGFVTPRAHASAEDLLASLCPAMAGDGYGDGDSVGDARARDRSIEEQEYLRGFYIVDENSLLPGVGKADDFQPQKRQAETQTPEPESPAISAVNAVSAVNAPVRLTALHADFVRAQMGEQFAFLNKHRVAEGCWRENGNPIPVLPDEILVAEILVMGCELAARKGYQEWPLPEIREILCRKLGNASPPDSHTWFLTVLNQRLLGKSYLVTRDRRASGWYRDQPAWESALSLALSAMPPGRENGRSSRRARPGRADPVRVAV